MSRLWMWVALGSVAIAGGVAFEIGDKGTVAFWLIVAGSLLVIRGLSGVLGAQASAPGAVPRKVLFEASTVLLASLGLAAIGIAIIAGTIDTASGANVVIGVIGLVGAAAGCYAAINAFVRTRGDGER